MAKQLTDEEINLRRKLRRRLIGASALILTLVVVLPMVLDSEPKISGQDIELRIPAPDKVGEFVPGVASVELADTPVSAVSAVSVPVAEMPINPVVASSVAAVTAPVVILPVVKKSEASSVEIKKPEVKKPEAKVADKPPVVAEKSATSFVAQVGAYSNADTAQQQYTQLKDWHFKAYTEKVGDKTRVRVGPYASREQAEQVRALLEKHGLHPVVSSAK
ncbi:MAG: SPOR domain-containing protein [Gallionella sp.]